MTPTVSVIIPCYNEEATIVLLLDALYNQTYARRCLQVIIADGMSTDGTRQVIEHFRASHPDIALHVVDNPTRIIPSALNRALAAATSDIIVRLDAHSVPQPDYIDVCVSHLEQGTVDMVGGVWDIRPRGNDWIARAIAAAASHPLAVGDARYRYSNQAGPVDTVPFGAYRRETVQRLGGYDESLLTNEDYEFNTRIRQAGGTVWLDPHLRTVYYARHSLAALARQYWRYGYWKYRMLKRYPGTLRWRQAGPPAFLVGLILLLLFALFSSPLRWVLITYIGIYALVLLVASLQFAIQRRDLSLLAGLPLSIAVMHFSWGAGFLWSVMDYGGKR